MLLCSTFLVYSLFINCIISLKNENSSDYYLGKLKARFFESCCLSKSNLNVMFIASLLARSNFDQFRVRAGRGSEEGLLAPALSF